MIAWPAFINAGHNPYNSLLYSGLARLGARVEDFSPGRLIFGRHDVWHLHWPESILNLPQPWKALPLAFTLRLLLRVARAKGTRIVWTVHNLRSHEGLYPGVEARLWRALMAHLDGYIALTDAGRAQAVRCYPSLRERPGFVIPHGHYRAVYPDTVSGAEARAHLGLPQGGRVLLALGQVRPYKNVPHLIRTFRALAAPDAILVVAGLPVTPELAAEVRAAAAGDRRVRVHLGFVPDGEVQVYLRAADLVVLPYRQILNSGSAILALSFARPVLVPEQGAMAELQRAAGREWVRTYPGALDPAVLRDALEWALHTPRDPGGLFAACSWEVIARQTLAAYLTVLSLSPANTPRRQGRAE
ncbi:MAG TPA: glycosyltransferase [Vicinamibacteria bacterium]